MAVTMLISGSSIVEKSKDSSGILSLSHYLQIDTDTGAQTKILFDEYRKAYEESSIAVQPVSREINIATPVDAEIVLEIPHAGSNLNPVLGLILEKLKMQALDAITEDLQLTIRSELSEFLELPWEAVAGTACVIREVICRDTTEVQDPIPSKHFLFVKSHSYQPDKSNIGNDINDEITGIFTSLAKTSGASFRGESIHFLKHATKVNLENITWDKYNFAHIALHGEEDGRLCLEDPQTYDNIEHMTKDAFLSILGASAHCRFTLFFLSFCFSGGGTISTNLAFELVKNGFTISAIGYSGGVGSPSAKKFALGFYDHLTYGSEPRDSFQKAFTKYKNESQTGVYMPMFYTKAQIPSRITV